MQQNSNMRDAVEATAKYYLQGGSSDSQALTFAGSVWNSRPANATVTVTRSCTCLGVAVSCGSGVICSDNSVPQIYVAIAAQSNWSDPYTPNIFPNGLALTESETVRVR